MSLQTRLAALIAAIGADIKSLAAGKADASKGVTNGDAHDHSGGDGAQIAYASLSGLPTLGTAATATVTTSSTDTTAGRITKVGDFGWGGEPQTLSGSWNALGGESRLVKGALNTTTDGPFSGAYWLFGSYIKLSSGGHAYFYGVTLNAITPRVFLRIMSAGVWQPWIEMPRADFDAQFAALTASVVGITANSSSPALTITQTGTGDCLRVEDSTSPDSTPFVIDAAGRVGIGVASPGTKLHVGSPASAYAGEIDADNSIAAYKNAGNQATIRVIAASYGNASEANLDLANFASKNLNLRSGFRLSAGVGAGEENTNEYLAISAIRLLSNGTISSTERLRIDSAGQLGVGLIPTARNNTGLQIVDGIGFPAAQVASSDPNTLDDYEEGVFTPVAVGTTTAGTGTYVGQLGRYTKIGNRVFFSIALDWTNHTGTGDLRIDGLPFIAAAIPFNNTALSVYPTRLGFTSGNHISARVEAAFARVLFSQSAPSTAAITIPMDNEAGVSVSGHYFV